MDIPGRTGYNKTRFFIGPPWRKTTDGDFWDWSALSLAAYTPATASTVAVTVTAVATSITVTDASTWPLTGGVWLGVGAMGESLAYATYTGRTGNLLTGCTRDVVDSEYSGIHTAGATATFWFPLNMETGTFTLTDQMDINLSTSSWEMDLSGVNAPIGALRTGHLVICQIASVSGGGWGAWTNFAVGWVSRTPIQDDETKTRQWSMTVVGLGGMLVNEDITGIHVGDIDLADQANVTASSTLSPVRKEIGLGELTATSEIVDASAIVDGSIDTGWWSGRYYGENNPQHDPQSSNIDGIQENYGITQVHVSKYTGQGDGYRWVEISWYRDAVASVWLIAGVDYMVSFEGGGGLQYNAGDIVILAENPALFSEENPESQAADVLDLADWKVWNMGNQKYTVVNDGTGGTYTLTVGAQTTGPLAYNASVSTVQTALTGLSTVGVDNVRLDGWSGSFFVTFINILGSLSGPGLSGSGASLTGGTLTVTESSPPVFPWETTSTGPSIFDHVTAAGGMFRLLEGPSQNGQSQVVWGSTEPMTTWTPTWTGSALAALGTGETARMMHNPTSPTVTADFWQVGRISTPGYTILTADKAWLLFDLPEIGLFLSAAITATVPGVGDALAMENVSDVSAEGLPATGTIQIGDEQIAYSARDFKAGTVTVSARGANSTTAAIHSANDLIYFVTPAGVATDAYPIKTIKMRRPAGFAVPADFIVRSSALTLARTPDDANYTVDYTTLATVTGNTAEIYSLDVSATDPRIRWLLIELTVMSDPVSRIRVNEVDIRVSEDVLSVDNMVIGGTVADVVETIISQADLPAGAVIDIGNTTSPSEYTTSGGSMWPVLADVANYTLTRITVGRDSKLTVRLDPFWAGTPAADYTWGRTEIRHVSTNRSVTMNVGTVELDWRPLDDKGEETVTQPSPASRTGSVQRIGPYVYADETAALAGALKRFWQMRRPFDTTMDAAFTGMNLVPGQVATLTWDYSGRTEIRNYMIGRVSLQFTEFSWASAVVGVQITRSDER